MSYEQWLRVQQYTETSIHLSKNIIRRFKLWCRRHHISVIKVQHKDIINYMHDIGLSRIKRRSNYTYLSKLKNYYYWLIQDGKIKNNPCADIFLKGINRQSLYPLLSLDELEMLYQNYPCNTQVTGSEGNFHMPDRLNLTKLRNRIIVGLIVYQGLSVEEVLRLTTADINIETNTVSLKGMSRIAGRSLQLHEAQIQHLQDYLVTVRPQLVKHANINGHVEEELIFPFNGGKWSGNMISHLLMTLRKINSNVISLDQLRTSVFTDWLTHIDIREVRRMAGHHSIVSTHFYLQYVLHDLKEDIEKYHPF